MSKDKKSVLSKDFSQDKLRQKVDGFSLNATTDQGVYYPPDDKV